MGQFDHISEEDRDKNKSRFAGYNLPMVQLDSTGPSYVVAFPHQYLQNQPLIWGETYFVGHPGGFSQVHLQNDKKLFPFPQLDENV